MSIYLSHLSLLTTSSPSLAISLGILHPPLISLSMSTSGALATFTFGDKQAVTMTTNMTEADFSGKLNHYEAHIVAAFLPKCQ